jgi:iron-sulfur cluster assembly protein
MAITLTESAADRVRTFLEREGGGIGLRLGIRKTGCSGFAYTVDLAKRIDDEDRVYESQGVKVVVDTRTLPLIDGTRIDFVREGLNEGFQYDNPNVRSQCGCGESFGV